MKAILLQRKVAGEWGGWSGSDAIFVMNIKLNIIKNNISKIYCSESLWAACCASMIDILLYSQKLPSCNIPFKTC